MPPEAPPLVAMTVMKGRRWGGGDGVVWPDATIRAGSRGVAGWTGLFGCGAMRVDVVGVERGLLWDCYAARAVDVEVDGRWVMGDGRWAMRRSNAEGAVKSKAASAAASASRSARASKRRSSSSRSRRGSSTQQSHLPRAVPALSRRNTASSVLAGWYIPRQILGCGELLDTPGPPVYYYCYYYYLLSCYTLYSTPNPLVSPQHTAPPGWFRYYSACGSCKQ